MKKSVTVVEGMALYNPYTKFSDNSKEISIDGVHMQSLMWSFRGKRVRVTVEELPDEENIDE